MAENKIENQAQVKEHQEYTPNRFEFAIYVNEFVICKRNFKINFFNEQSFYSAEMKHQLDDIVTMIDEELKSKSRLYTWYYFDEEVTDDELHQPLIEPWECTFKLVISDNGQEMISRIWDGRFYPRAIREKVDLTNRFVEINGNKIDVEKIDPNRLPGEAYVNKILINGRTDMVSKIIKKICEVSSPSEISIDDSGHVIKSGNFVDDSDYETTLVYDTIEDGKKVDSKKYVLSKSARFQKMCSDWGASVAEKTRKYFEEDFYNTYANIKRR